MGNHNLVCNYSQTIYITAAGVMEKSISVRFVIKFKDLYLINDIRTRKELLVTANH